MSTTATTNGLALSRPAAEVQDYLRRSIGELATACPRHLTPERLIQVASICVYKTPKIADCDHASILTAIIQAGSLGLDLSPNRGEGYLIPRWNKQAGVMECQFQPGFKGLAKLARGTGEVAFIQARLVHSRDKFRYWHEDDTLHLTHEPSIEASPGVVTHVYALCKLKSGDRVIEVMTRDEIESIRMRSERANSGPWADYWGEMAKKTAIKRLCKSLDQSAELARAIELDDREYADAPERPALPANNSGHGKGMYASPDQSAAWLKRLDEYIAGRNSAWLDKWTDKTTGEIPSGIKDLCNRWQADNHLLKWAKETGRLDPASGTDEGGKAAQVGRFTAIVVNRSKEDERATTKELVRYLDEQESRQAEKLRTLHPELFGDMYEGEVDDKADDDTGEAS